MASHPDLPGQRLPFKFTHPEERPVTRGRELRRQNKGMKRDGQGWSNEVPKGLDLALMSWRCNQALSYDLGVGWGQMPAWYSQL